MQLMTNFLFLFIVVIITAIIGYKQKSLSWSGAFGTILVGLATVLGFGAKGLIMLGVFFVTSSHWSKYKRENKRLSEEIINKTGARDVVQVLANGSVPAILSILYFFFHNDLLLYMFISALATANSDTWASEIGSTSRKQPIYILSFKKVASGTSGAISFLGTVAAFFGAFLIGMISYFLWSEVSLQLSLLIGLIGFLGNLIDSLLGATVQVTYNCPNCGISTEKTNHCGQKTNYKNGLKLFNNDMVNFSSIILGSLIILLFL